MLYKRVENSLLNRVLWKQTLSINGDLANVHLMYANYPYCSFSLTTLFSVVIVCLIFFVQFIYVFFYIYTTKLSIFIYQMQRRTTRRKLGLQGNFYPVTTSVFLDDRDRRLTVLTTESHGVASLASGI